MKYLNFFSQAFKSGFRLPNYSTQNELFPRSNCIRLDGKRLSQDIVAQATIIGNSLLQKTPKLAIILVGDDPASHIYVKNKQKIFEKAKFLTTLVNLSPNQSSEKEIIELIEVFNQDSSIHGILVQLPLPKEFNTERILSRISPQKDIDGFSTYNLGCLALNQKQSHIACTPLGIMMLLSAYGINVHGKNCVVIGRSRIVGKPMGLLLMNENATVTFLHSYSENIKSFTQNADILIVATGQKHFIQKDDIKPHAVVIDVGIHKNADGSLSGDVHPNVSEVASALTPVPKGVGPMTIAGLIVNIILAAQN